MSRPSVWGNPFPVASGVGGLFPRADAIRMHRELVFTGKTTFDVGETVYTFHRASRPGPLYAPTVDDIRRHLAGRDLVCWCPLDVPCHADVLLEIANTPKGPTTP